MRKSLFIVDDEYLEIKSIIYSNGELSIKTTNNYTLNVYLNFDITKLANNTRENISKKIYSDQNFATEKYSYVIDIGNDIFLTNNDGSYLLEFFIPKVNILIPPFDNINNRRLDPKNDYDELEIHKLEGKIYFN